MGAFDTYFARNARQAFVALVALSMAGCARPAASGTINFVWLGEDGKVIHAVERDVTSYRNGVCEHDRYPRLLSVIAQTPGAGRDELIIMVVDRRVKMVTTARWSPMGGYLKLYPRLSENLQAVELELLEGPNVEGTISGSLARVDRVWHVDARGDFPTRAQKFSTVTFSDDGQAIPSKLIERVEWRVNVQVPSISTGYGFWDWC